MKIRVVVADDHALMRRTVRRVLARTDTIEVVGEATNGREAIERVQRGDVDVLLTDLQMPEIDGMGVLQQIVKLGLGTKVVVVSLFVDAPLVTKALKEGAMGYVAKESIPGHLVPAVQGVHAGQQYLGPVAQRALDG